MKRGGVVMEQNQGNAHEKKATPFSVGDMVSWNDGQINGVADFFQEKCGAGPFKVESTKDGPGSQVVFLTDNGMYMRQFSSVLFKKV